MGLPIDLVVLREFVGGLQVPYFSQSEIYTTWEFGLGIILRPLINFSMLVLLTRELLLFAHEKPCIKMGNIN